MIHAKSFSFPFAFGYTINAIAYLYEDGALKDVEIEHVMHGGKDMFRIWRPDAAEAGLSNPLAGPVRGRR